MAKRRRRSKADSTPNLSPEELLVRGDAFLNQNNFKDAIPCFKQLIKIDDSGWQDHLHRAYIGRAEELAEKSLFKEALIIWNNARAIKAEGIPLGKVVAWMFDADQIDKAVALFIENEKLIQEQNPELHEDIEEFIAAQLLTSSQVAFRNIPPDSAWSNLHSTATEALSAYVEGRSEDVDIALRKIPLRSPFKPIRIVMKALLLWPTDSDKSLRLLEKISDRSPFNGLAKVIRCCTLNGEIFANQLALLTHPQQKLVATLRGVTKNQLKLILQLISKENKTAIRTLLSDHSDIFSEKDLRSYFQTLILDGVYSIKQYEQQFDPLPPWQQARVEALLAEKKDRFTQAFNKWLECLRHLQSEPKSEETNLKMALIHRHMAELGKLEGYSSQSIIVDHLEKSLKYDPDDKEVWLRIVQIHKEEGNTKLYHQWVDEGIKQFPTDSSMLTLAMNAAFDKKTFVKAARFGMRVLELDPINTGVRHQLINAHISHAWKKYNDGQSHLAMKEIGKARQLEQSERGENWCTVHQGFLSIHMGEETAGISAINEVLDSANPGIVLPCHVLLEGGVRNVEEKYLKFVRDKLSNYNRESPVSNHVVEVIALFEQYAELDTGVIKPAALFKVLSGYFKKAAKLKYDKEPLRLVCEALKNFDQFQLLKLFGQAGENQYPSQTVFTYYRVFAQSKGDISKVSYKDAQTLEDAIYNLRREGDMENAHRIIAFLEGYDDDDDDDCDIFGNPFDFVPDEAPEMLLDMVGMLLVQSLFEKFDNPGSMDDSTLINHMRDILEEKEFPAGLESSMMDVIFKRAISEIREMDSQKPKKPKSSSKGSGRKKSIFEQLSFDLDIFK